MFFRANFENQLNTFLIFQIFNSKYLQNLLKTKNFYFWKIKMKKLDIFIKNKIKNYLVLIFLFKIVLNAKKNINLIYVNHFFFFYFFGNILSIYLFILVWKK